MVGTFSLNVPSAMVSMPLQHKSNQESFFRSLNEFRGTVESLFSPKSNAVSSGRILKALASILSIPFFLKLSC